MTMTPVTQPDSSRAPGSPADPIATSVDSRPPSPVPFMVTKEHPRFAEFADAVRRDRYIGLCYGAPGVGKTLSARHYAGWDTVEPYLRTFRFDESVPVPEQARTTRSIVYTPAVANTPRTVEKGVTFYHTRLSWGIGLSLYPGENVDARAGLGETNGPFAELLIIDEADRLKTPALEHLRDHHDRTGIGLVLIGMPGIEKRLARYPQLYSRVGFVHHYRPLSAQEQAFVLARHWPGLGLRGDDIYVTCWLLVRQIAPKNPCHIPPKITAGRRRPRPSVRR